MASWQLISDQLRRRVGMEIFPPSAGPSQRVKDHSGSLHSIATEQLEDLIGPTIICSPGRSGVIVSIRREYARELLGIYDQLQFSFVESKAASFLTTRGYINSPRAASLMQPGRPILFYESERSGGRGAIIAIARIVDSVVQPKTAVTEEDRRRLVVEELEEFSASDDVLVSTFDNILLLPQPYSRQKLASINALGSSNLQTATMINAANLQLVIDGGWAIGK